MTTLSYCGTGGTIPWNPPRARRPLNSRPSTLREVAERARVSIKTASRVANAEARVAPETAARVQAAIEALRYVPNLAARRLVRRRSFVLGVVYHNRSWNWLNDVQRGAIEAARARDYEILMHPLQPDSEKDRKLLRQVVEQGSVDGWILTPPCGDDAEIAAYVLERGVPCVRIAPTRREGAEPSVSASDFEGAYAMGRHLVSLGHERIAFVAGGPEQRSSHDRRAGFEQALREVGLRLEEDDVFEGDFSFESGLACGRRLVAKALRPTAVFACNDDMAAGVLSAAHEARIEVPTALSVAGFDDVELARQVWPPLTTVRQPTARIAHEATNLLIEALEGRLDGPMHRVLGTTLVVRASTAARCS